MNPGPRLDEDYHVHSTFSDDAVSSLAENVAAARERGLRTLCLSDHVRRGTAWVPEFLAAVDALRPVPGLSVLAGVEAKILNLAGELDLPAGAGQADLILIADHQFPGDPGPVHPREIRAAVDGGEITVEEAIDCLVEATANALKVAGRPQLAHLFSILPKIGIDESRVPDQAIRHLARQARIAGALVEINEKWACPSARTAAAFAAAGVRLVASTDSHDCADIGVYSTVRRIAGGAFPGRVP
jgi:putative hydrolase